MSADLSPSFRAVPTVAGDPATPHEELVEQLVPIAAELVGTVRDYGPDNVAAVLARVPEGRHDALAVVLAAMVDPDARPQQLLAWTELGPVSSRSWEPPVYRSDRKPCTECGLAVSPKHMARHQRTHRRAVA